MLLRGAGGGGAIRTSLCGYPHTVSFGFGNMKSNTWYVLTMVCAVRAMFDVLPRPIPWLGSGANNWLSEHIIMRRTGFPPRRPHMPDILQQQQFLRVPFSSRTREKLFPKRNILTDLLGTLVLRIGVCL